MRVTTEVKENKEVKKWFLSAAALLVAVILLGCGSSEKSGPIDGVKGEKVSPQVKCPKSSFGQGRNAGEAGLSMACTLAEARGRQINFDRPPQEATAGQVTITGTQVECAWCPFRVQITFQVTHYNGHWEAAYLGGDFEEAVDSIAQKTASTPKTDTQIVSEGCAWFAESEVKLGPNNSLKVDFQSNLALPETDGTTPNQDLHIELFVILPKHAVVFWHNNNSDPGIFYPKPIEGLETFLPTEGEDPFPTVRLIQFRFTKGEAVENWREVRNLVGCK